MTSLLDIGPLTEEVSIGKKKVTVYGVTPEGFFFLLNKFPALQILFDKRQKLDMALLQEAAPDCVAYTLAVATTDRGEHETKEWVNTIGKAARIARQLSAHHQMAIFQAALRLTFPEGIGPFMQGVVALASSIENVSRAGEAVLTTDQDTTSSKRSRTGFTTDSRGLRLGKGAPSASSSH